MQVFYTVSLIFDNQQQMKAESIVSELSELFSLLPVIMDIIFPQKQY